MAAFSTYVSIALGGLVLLASDVVYAQSYSNVSTTGAGRNKKPADPSEYFLVAFGLCKDAEKLAKEGNYGAAMKKGRQAEKVLATLVRDFPDWKPDMVRYRREKLAKSMAEYKKASAGAAIPTGRQPGSSVPKVTPIIPNIPETPGTPYIDPDKVRLPNYDTTDPDLYNTLARLKEECSRMTRAYAELDAQYKKIQKELIATQMDMKMYKERYETLQREIATERHHSNELVAQYARKLAETEAKLRESEQAREEAEARAAELGTKLAETQAELERVTKERDALKAENEQLRAIVELNNPEKTKALLDQNLTLAEQLERAKQRVEELEATIAGSADENDVLNRQLEAARDEVEELRDQLTAIYDENRGYRHRVSELTERLNNLEAAAAAQAAQPTVDPALAEEARVLKEIIAKQRRTIEVQEEGRRMLIDAYKQLKSENSEMLAQLEQLENESRVELTESERQLIESIRKGEPIPGQPDEAGTEAVRRGLTIETLANQADKAFSKGRYTAAEQLYRTLYDHQPDHVAGLVNLGTILLYRNKCEEAIEYLSRATRLAPDLPISYFLAGISYYRLDRMEEAAQMFAYTIELDPANAEAFFYLANIEGINGETERALSHFAAAVKLKPTLADAHYNMARLYAEMGRIPDAARAYDRAIQAGAEPDMEFDNFLRNHPDNAKAPGADLVAEVKPEDEAAKLKKQKPAEQPTDTPAEQPTDTPAEQPTDTPAEQPTDTPAEQPTDTPAEQPTDTPAEQPTDTPSEQPTDTPAEQQPEVTPEEAERQAVMNEIVRRETEGAKSAPTPSAAGKAHTVDKSRFTTKTVRVKQGHRTKRVKLRLKLPAAQRLRKSGGEAEVLNPADDKSAKKGKKNGKK